jgi:hypothetical protein
MSLTVEAWEQLAGECEGEDDSHVVCPPLPLGSQTSATNKPALNGVDESSTSSDEHSGPEDCIHVEPREGNPVSKQTRSPSLDRKQSRYRRIGGFALRTLLLDLPLLVIFIVYACLEWIDYVHHNYLYKQLNAMVFTEQRRQEEITYYSRPCDATDLSTHNGKDLFLPRNATPEEAYEHQLLHGFTVFREVLSSDTASALRQHVASRNRNLKQDEVIYVIENDNRFSFGLGTEEPAVTKAMMELANHPQLRPSLEKIMGPDPALIEMTAITSSYGAIAQYYHDDVRRPVMIIGQ